jgi:capsular polysaccharide transport system permease protein
LTDLSPLNATTVVDVERSREMAAAISRALRRAARQARHPAPLIVGGGVPVRRGDRAFRLGIIASFVAIVILPAFVAGVYWGLIASPQFATETKFSLRSNESSGTDPLSGIAGLPSSQQAQDTQIIVSYIESPALLKDLIKTVNLVAMYDDPSIDYISRLQPDWPIEKFEKYWKKYVDAQYESNTGIVTVNVRAFTPQDSEKILNEIIRSSENLVNELADGPLRDALAQAKLELTSAEEGLQEATLAMRDARNSEGVLDATASAQVINNIVSTLRMKLLETENALGTLGSQAQNAPQVRIYDAQAARLKQQIDSFNSQIAESSGSQSMATRLSALSFVQTKLDVARQRYTAASSAYQAARIDMETQRAYVVAFLQPILAQKSTYPHRWLQWLVVVGPSLLLWSVGAALVRMARDNMAK